MQAKILWGVALLGIDLMVNPSLNLLKAVGIAIVLDLATGILKAKMRKQARTSKGYRKTMVKLSQYLVPVLILSLAGKWIPEKADLLNSAAGYVMMFIIYIEVTSIFENLYEIDKTSTIAKYLYRPALVILKFGIEHNPVTKAADNIVNEKPVSDPASNK